MKEGFEAIEYNLSSSTTLKLCQHGKKKGSTAVLIPHHLFLLMLLLLLQIPVSTQQEPCSLCPDGTLVANLNTSDREITLLDNHPFPNVTTTSLVTTCDIIQQNASQVFQRGTDECINLQFHYANLCDCPPLDLPPIDTTTTSPSSSLFGCSLCDPGSRVNATTNPILDLTLNLTCLDLERQLTFVDSNSDLCQREQSSPLLKVFCGCGGGPGMLSKQVCSICDVNDMKYPDYTPLVATTTSNDNNENVNTTCAMLEQSFNQFPSIANQCVQNIETIQVFKVLCGCPLDDILGNDGDDNDDDFVCILCPDNTIPDPSLTVVDRAITDGTTITTCGRLSFLALVNTGFLKSGETASSSFGRRRRLDPMGGTTAFFNNHDEMIEHQLETIMSNVQIDRAQAMSITTRRRMQQQQEQSISSDIFAFAVSTDTFINEVACEGVRLAYANLCQCTPIQQQRLPSPPPPLLNISSSILNDTIDMASPPPPPLGTPPVTCSLCADGFPVSDQILVNTLVNAASFLSPFADDVLINCLELFQQLREYIPADSTYCTFVQEQVSVACGCPNAPPTSCLLCEQQEQQPAVILPNPTLPVDRVNTTCAQLETTLPSFLNPRQCQAIQATVGITCGCSNPVAFQEYATCRICGTTLLPEPLREIQIITSPREIFKTTCLSAETSRLINNGDSTACAEFQETLGPLCCTPEMTQSPSLSPTSNNDTLMPSTLIINTTTMTTNGANDNTANDTASPTLALTPNISTTSAPSTSPPSATTTTTNNNSAGHSFCARKMWALWFGTGVGILLLS